MDILIMQVLILLIFLSISEQNENLDMKKMMMELNERVLLTEEKMTKTETILASTKNELDKALIELATTKSDLNIALEKLASKEEIATALSNMTIALNDLANTTREDLERLNKDLLSYHSEQITKVNELNQKISFLKDPPFFHTCGYQGSTYINSKTISYSTLLYSSTNTEVGGLDIETGVFTSPHPGSYTASWSLQAHDYAGDSVDIYLYRNSERVEESRLYSDYSGPSGTVYDQGNIVLDSIVVVT